jgi:hypothetical protein
MTQPRAVAVQLDPWTKTTDQEDAYLASGDDEHCDNWHRYVCKMVTRSHWQVLCEDKILRTGSLQSCLDAAEEQERWLIEKKYNIEITEKQIRSESHDDSDCDIVAGVPELDALALMDLPQEQVDKNYGEFCKRHIAPDRLFKMAFGMETGTSGERRHIGKCVCCGTVFGEYVCEKGKAKSEVGDE